MVRLAIIILLVAFHLIFGIPEFLCGTECYWLRATTYSFFHANWFHLAVNSLAIWTVFDPKRKARPFQIAAAYMIAVLVYPLSFRPVIGFSNILYATLGLRTPSLSAPWWKQPAVIAFLAVTLAMLAVPSFSATTHIASFVLGMVVSSARRGYLKLTEDARRYL